MDQVQCMRSIQKPTEGQYSPVRLEQAGLVSSVLYGTCELSKSKNYTAYDRFLGNVPYGKIPSKKEPMRTFGFTLKLPCHKIIKYFSLNSILDVID